MAVVEEPLCSLRRLGKNCSFYLKSSILHPPGDTLLSFNVQLIAVVFAASLSPFQDSVNNQYLFCVVIILSIHINIFLYPQLIVNILLKELYVTQLYSIHVCESKKCGEEETQKKKDMKKGNKEGKIEGREEGKYIRI